MAGTMAYMEVITQIVAGVSVIIAFLTIALSMTFFLISGRLAYRIKPPAGHDNSISQLAVLRDNLHWGTMPSTRQGEQDREPYNSQPTSQISRRTAAKADVRNRIGSA